ncbi:MAG: FAD-dependent oxidoreductase, partial [Chloroflexota bacterium]
RVIKRMAVTSVGENESGGYDVCLENGLAMSTRGVMIASAARTAERMLRALSPDAADALLPYHYDDVTRVALGYTAANRPPEPPRATPEMLFARLHSTDHTARTPEGGLLVQAAVRAKLANTTPERFVEVLTERMGWGVPDAVYVHTWGTSDPLSITGPAARLHSLDALLPPRVSVIGNCYQNLSLPQRADYAAESARALVAALSSGD